jgi:hypothetical protein
MLSLDSNMKQALENIVEKGKEIGRRSLEFVKNNAKVLAMVGGLAVVGYAFDKTTPKAYGAEISIKNYTSNSSFGKGILYTRTFVDANEVYDIHDGHFGSLPNQNELEISSNEPEFRAGVNAKLRC